MSQLINNDKMQCVISDCPMVHCGAGGLDNKVLDTIITNDGE